MDIFDWIFADLPKESQLAPVKKVRKNIKVVSGLFNDLYIQLKHKQRLIKSSRSSRNERFFNSPKKRREILNVNKQLMAIIAKLNQREDLEEHLLQVTLVNASTRLHQISDDIDISVVNRFQQNEVEDAKLRCYEALKDPGKIKSLMGKSRYKEQEIKGALQEYTEFLSRQDREIKRNRVDTFKGLIDEEDRLLANLRTQLLNYVKFQINETKGLLSVLMAPLKSRSLFHNAGQGRPAILLLHGYSSTPEDNREVSAYFAQEGYSVFAPRFPGNATSDEEFSLTSIDELVHFAQGCLDHLYQQNNQRPVLIAGQSLGGTITLLLASNKDNYPKIRGIVTLNAYWKVRAIGVRAFRHAIPVIKWGLRRMPGLMPKTNVRFTPFKLKKFFDGPMTLNPQAPEESLVREFNKRLDEDYEQLLREQISQHPNQEKQIRDEYQQVRVKAEADFRRNYRSGKFTQNEMMDLVEMIQHDMVNVMSFKHLAQIDDLTQLTAPRLKNIVAPCLIIQSKNDWLVNPKSAEIIRKGLTQSQKVELRWIAHAGHVLTLERKRFEACSLINRFAGQL